MIFYSRLHMGKPLSTYAPVFPLMASVNSVNIVFLVGCSGSHCGRYAPFKL